MADLECDIIWKIKDNLQLTHDEITSILINDVTFTHKSGRTVSIDFEDYSGNYDADNRIINFTGFNIDEDYINESLEYCGDSSLIPEEYDYSFFEDGYMYLDKNHPDNGIEIELDINDTTVNDKNYIELAFVRIRDLDNNENVILLNKLSQWEYDKYLGW